MQHTRTPSAVVGAVAVGRRPAGLGGAFGSLAGHESEECSGDQSLAETARDHPHRLGPARADPVSKATPSIEIYAVGAPSENAQPCRDERSCPQDGQR